MHTTIDEIERIAESMPDPFYRTIFLFLLKKIVTRNVFLRNEGLFEKYLNFEKGKEKELNAKKKEKKREEGN